MPAPNHQGRGRTRRRGQKVLAQRWVEGQGEGRGHGGGAAVDGGVAGEHRGWAMGGRGVEGVAVGFTL